MKHRLLILSMLLISTGMNASHAQVIDSLKGQAAFIFAYYPKESLQQEFEQGYKQHLDWHRRNNDQLPWYAWYVQTGSRLGLFIDGTFGISFRAFDNRVNRSEDAADFAKTTAPYAALAFRKVYKLRKDLSTTFLLENWNPTTGMEAFDITVFPGAEKNFEHVFFEFVNAVEDTPNNPGITLYQLISGDEHSGYLLLVPRNNFSYYDDDKAIINIKSLVETYVPDKAPALLEDLSRSIKRKTSETWQYRQDLSYFPEKKP
ncbi:hypothetical protein QQ008_15035 [Fulvivirgaceae bacterium BMA10]|uniref:Uncharacterized protein n=1 Tax=Splendidivirga corallicola TaxID=3051826 RepID=A0ABT8KPN1_9BACT|nr:hypothetical protein [Fulvivirgaceae bacterium BMA10]